MTDIYDLWDHRCPELERLLEEKRVRFQGWACWCSPIERHYQIFENDEWQDIDDCPFCGKSMMGMETFPVVPMGISTWKSATCPKCGHEFTL